MTRLLLAVLALSALGYMAYRTMYGTTSATTETQQLENVRSKAKDIEAKDQQHVEEIEKKMQE